MITGPSPDGTSDGLSETPSNPAIDVWGDAGTGAGGAGSIGAAAGLSPAAGISGTPSKPAMVSCSRDGDTRVHRVAVDKATSRVGAP